MTRQLSAGARSIATVLTVLAVLVYVVGYALLPFILAAAVAFVADPVVSALARHTGGRRWPGALLVYLVIVAAVAAAALFTVKVLLPEAVTVIRQAPHLATRGLSRLLGPQGLTVFGRTYTAQDIMDQAEAAIDASFDIGIAAHFIGSGLAAILEAVFFVVLMPYFLISGPRLAAGAIWLVPPARRPAVEAVLVKLLRVLRRYLTGVAAVVCYTTLVAWCGLALVFRLPHATVIAVIVGLLEMLPVVGPVTSALLVTVVGLRTANLGTILGLIILVAAMRLTIDNIVGPLVLGRAARLHPVVVMFAFVLGTMLFGVVGLLLAVPVAVCVKVTLQHCYAEPIADSRA